MIGKYVTIVYPSTYDYSEGCPTTTFRGKVDYIDNNFISLNDDGEEDLFQIKHIIEIFYGD